MPHLRRDCAHLLCRNCAATRLAARHICTGTGLAACRICAATRLTHSTSAPGLGLLCAGVWNAQFGLRRDGTFVVGYIPHSLVDDTTNPFEVRASGHANATGAARHLERDARRASRTGGRRSWRA